MSLNVAQAFPRHQVDFSTAKVGHSLDISAVNSQGWPVLYTFRDKWPVPYNQHALSKLAANIATKRDAGQAVVSSTNPILESLHSDADENELDLINDSNIVENELDQQFHEEQPMLAPHPRVKFRFSS